MRIRSAIDRVMLQISMCRQQPFIADSILELDRIQRQRRIYKPQLADQAERRPLHMRSNKKGIKKNVGKALHSVGDLMENVTNMF